MPDEKDIQCAWAAIFQFSCWDYCRALAFDPEDLQIRKRNDIPTVEDRSLEMMVQQIDQETCQYTMVAEVIQSIKKLTTGRVKTVYKYVQEMHEKFPLFQPALKKLLVYLEPKVNVNSKKIALLEEELMSLVKEFSSAAFEVLQIPVFLKVIEKCRTGIEEELPLPEAALKALKKSNAKSKAPELLKMLEEDELFNACLQWSRSEGPRLDNSEKDKDLEDEDVEIPESDPSAISAINNDVKRDLKRKATFEKSNEFDGNDCSSKQVMEKNSSSELDKQKPKSPKKFGIKQRRIERSPRKKVPRPRSPSLILCYDSTTNEMRKANELVKKCEVRLVDIKPVKLEHEEIENDADKVTETLANKANFQQTEQKIGKSNNLVIKNDADKVTGTIANKANFRQTEQKIGKSDNFMANTSDVVVLEDGKNGKSKCEESKTVHEKRSLQFCRLA